jgi:hypothetical protein
MGVTNQNRVFLQVSQLPKSGPECGHIQASSRHSANFQLLLEFVFVQVLRNDRHICHDEKENSEINTAINNKTTLCYQFDAPHLTLRGKYWARRKYSPDQYNGTGSERKLLGPPKAYTNKISNKYSVNNNKAVFKQNATTRI